MGEEMISVMEKYSQELADSVQERAMKICQNYPNVNILIILIILDLIRVLKLGENGDEDRNRRCKGYNLRNRGEKWGGFVGDR